MEETILCINHQGMPITQVCLNPDCSQEPLICSQCQEESHEGHPFSSLTKMKQTIKKFISKDFNESDLTKEGQLSFQAMQATVQEFQQTITQQTQKLSKLSSFVENLNESLLNVTNISEEQELAEAILNEIDKQKDSDPQLLNEMLSNLFLLLQVNKTGDDKQNGYTFTPSQVSQVRSHSVLERKAEFAAQLKDQVETQDQLFEAFLKHLGELIRENRQYLIARSLPQDEKIEMGNTDLGFPIKQQVKQLPEVKNEQLGIDEGMKQINMQQYTVEKCGIAKLDEGTGPTEIKKQMYKLCNYLIFYNTLMCEVLLPEPMLKGVPMKKIQSGELRFPIRCCFCKLLRIKSFVSFYFRFDLVGRFGKLCIFRGTDGRQIGSHEMCILWSNRVLIDYDSGYVDVPSIFTAIQYAQGQMCKYCGSTGASLKCNRQECQVFYHFNCLKQVKLMGLQLDHESKYRFLCEDHVRHNYQGQSDWFITRIRMKHIIQQGGQPAFTKRYNQIDWSQKHNDQLSSDDEGNYEDKN